MPEPLMEKFSWMCPELSQVEDSGKHSVTIKGVALYGNTVSKNGRRYVDEELKKSARTWIGKPINVNHDPSKNVGTIKWMEYDQDNRLEYVAVVNKQPYVDMIRMYGRNPKESSLKGVSVEAAYLHTVCSKCNTKLFSEHDYHTHMWEKHFIKTEPTQPFGIIGQALSIVEAPEEPGVSGTTIEVMETVQTGLNRLVETIIKTGEERMANKEIEGKAAIEKTIMIPWNQTPIAISGDAQVMKTDKLTITTIPETPPKGDQPQFGNKSTETLPSTITTKPVETKPPITFKEVKAPPKLNLTEDAPKLKLGEPFAGYTDFADCVAKNSDKENPEAYCGTIKHQTEGEVFFKRRVAETLNTLAESFPVLQSNLTEVYADIINRFNALPKDDTTWKELLMAIPKDDTTWKETITNLPKDDLGWKEAIINLPKDDTSWQQKLADSEQRLTTEIKRLDETFKGLPKDDVSWQPIATYLKESVEKLLKEMPAINEGFEKKLVETKALIVEGDKQATDKYLKIEEWYKTNLAAYEKDLKEYWQPLKEKLDKLEAQMKESEDKKVKETLDLTSKVEDLTTKTDNLEDKLKPQFKGKAKETAKTGTEEPQNPLTNRG